MKNDFETEIDDFTRYRIGFGAENYYPSQKEFKNMLYLVAYDISSPKRLRYVAKACEDYGIRVEYSVFECDLSERDFNALWHRFLDIINLDEDAVLAYKICNKCVKDIKSLGTVKRPGKVLLYML
jgi:CRISPR-associated protein Cas2